MRHARPSKTSGLPEVFHAFAVLCQSCRSAFPKLPLASLPLPLAHHMASAVLAQTIRSTHKPKSCSNARLQRKASLHLRAFSCKSVHPLVPLRAACETPWPLRPSVPNQQIRGPGSLELWYEARSRAPLYAGKRSMSSASHDRPVKNGQSRRAQAGAPRQALTFKRSTVGCSNTGVQQESLALADAYSSSGIPMPGDALSCRH